MFLVSEESFKNIKSNKKLSLKYIIKSISSEPSLVQVISNVLYIAIICSNTENTHHMFRKNGKITAGKNLPLKSTETKILLGFYFPQMVKCSMYLLPAEA